MASSIRSPRLALIGGAFAVFALVWLMVLSPIAQAGNDADLAVEKSDSPDPVDVGAVLTYTITVTNLDLSDSPPGVVVEDKLPNKVKFLSAVSSQGTCDRQGRKVTCELGTMTPGSSETVTIRVQPKDGGTISNTATVDSDFADPEPSNNEDTEATKVIEGPTCGGRAATIVGTTGDDVITGTEQRDVISALSGNDEVNALGGKDLVCGKGGRDKLKGKADGDLVKGGNGRDVTKGGGGDDTLRGGPKPDRLRGGSGNDLLAGGGGNDSCRGGSGTDTLKSC